jgi:hypothetical protein
MDLFFMGYVKDKVYVPTLLQNLQELYNTIHHDVASADAKHGMIIYIVLTLSG